MGSGETRQERHAFVSTDWMILTILDNKSRLSAPGSLQSASEVRDPSSGHCWRVVDQIQNAIRFTSGASKFMHVIGAGCDVANLMIWTTDPRIWILAPSSCRRL